MTASQGAHRRARTSAQLVTGLVASVIVALTGASAAMAAPETVDPSPSPSPSAPPPPTGTADDVTATLNNFGPFVIAGGQSVVTNLTLENASAYPVPGASASMSITKQPLTTRAELAEFFDDPASATMRKLTSVPAGTPEVDEDAEDAEDDKEAKPAETGTLRGRASTQVRIGASAKDLSLPEGTAGVYGVTTSYSIGSSTVLVDSMAVTWLDTDISTLAVTSVATIAGPPSRVATLLAGADVEGVTLLVDPTALPSASPLNELGDHETYLLPATNPDVASLAHAGDTALIDFALAESRSRARYAIADRPWIALSPVADQSVANWAGSSGAAAALLDRSWATIQPELPEVDGVHPAVVAVGAGEGQGAPVVVPDEGLSDLVANFRPSDPAGPSRIVAESALLAIAGDGTQGVVVSPGLNWIISGDQASANLEALMTAPWVRPRTLEETLALPAAEDVALPKAEGVAEDLPVDDVDSLATRLTDVTKLAQTAEVPALILGPSGRTLLEGVSSAARGSATRQEWFFTRATETVDATLDSVDIVRSSDINLIASSGEVPITVRNDLEVDATVTVVMRSTSPNLRVKSRPEITVPAGGEKTAMVPVEAVSSANVDLSVWLINPIGEPISEPQPFQMRVRADWGSAATAVFSGLLVLVLIGGIVRTIRRGRKDTRTGPTTPLEVGDAVIQDTAAQNASVHPSGDDHPGEEGAADGEAADREHND